MLVLSRHMDESIVIGDDIVITVVDIRGDKVRLGIDAPAEVMVHRLEVHRAVKGPGATLSVAVQEAISRVAWRLRQIGGAR